MIRVIGSLRAVLVSRVPNLVPTPAKLALSVLLGSELDTFTTLAARWTPSQMTRGRVEFKGGGVRE
jgi:hypothetical protein